MSKSIVYFSMEILLSSQIPTYSGGLGVLAGDTIKSAADLKLPMLAVTLLYRKGYVNQELDSQGHQSEKDTSWDVDNVLEELTPRVTVTIEGRKVTLRAFKYDVLGLQGHSVPVYLLDSDLLENSDWDRHITDKLYGEDNYYRLCQEVILGIGGIRMLRALGHHNLKRYHMNEGHAAFLIPELLNEATRAEGRENIIHRDIQLVRKACVFTTHTPVFAGHDQFPIALVRQVLGSLDRYIDNNDSLNIVKRITNNANEQELISGAAKLNMTYLALTMSRYVNGVARKHGEVSRELLGDHGIDAITNGVHVKRWVTKPIAKLFDRYVPSWQQDNFSLRYALNIPKNELWQAHIEAKQALLTIIKDSYNIDLNVETFTIGFARRATSYKRVDLIFSDLDKLRVLNHHVGPFQLVFSGKAHPKDDDGKVLIERIFAAKEELKDEIKVVYLENYNVDLGKLLTAGVDLWLNTPQPPLEASGTSGMKAALNGIPSLSILDGWWLEGHIEGVTGWSIGEYTDRNNTEQEQQRLEDAKSLYEKLEHKILPLYYQRQDRFIEIMQHAIALNGSFFNTQRMLQQYVLKAYFK